MEALIRMVARVVLAITCRESRSRRRELHELRRVQTTFAYWAAQERGEFRDALLAIVENARLAAQMLEEPPE